MVFRREPRYFHKNTRRTGKKTRNFMLALAWLYLALLSPAFGIEAILDGRAIRFEPPAGYCVLNELTAGEREAVEAMRKLRQPDHDLLWMFVPCNQLAALRGGKEGRLEQFGYVTAVHPTGVFKPGRAASRYEFASRVAKSLPPLDPAVLARELKKRDSLPNPARFNLLYSGVATMDAAAVYLGSVVEETWGRSRSLTAAVTAITLVKGRPVGVTMHGPISGISYQILRTELRPLIGDFITRNEPDVAPFQKTGAQTAGAGDTWLGGWWYNVLVGGLLSGALAGLILFAVRRLREQAAYAPRRDAASRSRRGAITR